MVDRYGRELKRLLRQYGCSFVRSGKGDHEIWYSPITCRNILVDAGGKKRVTAQETLKQAGIKERI